MKVIAISVKGHEFLYSLNSVHRVSDKNAKRICDCLNRNSFRLKENEVWHIHDVDKYDSAYDVAQFQKFQIRNGKLLEYT